MMFFIKLKEMKWATICSIEYQYFISFVLAPKKEFYCHNRAHDD